MGDQSKERLLHSDRYSLDERRASIDTASDLDATDYLSSPSKLRQDGQPSSQRPGLLSRIVPKIRKRTCIIITLIVGAVILIGTGGAGYKKFKDAPPDGLSPPYYPSPRGGTVKQWEDSYKKAEKMVSKMTLAEKVNVTTGTGWSMGLAVGNTGPAVNVGFPGLALQDGPIGLRFADHASAFPSGITIGATWNRDLMYAHGKAHGEEARLKGINVLLGPCVGPLGRMPAGGRNWEGFGSDPYLQGVGGYETTKGIQDEGVMATIKHFVGNEQEHFRQAWEWGLPHALSSNIDDRAMHEIYAWPFADAVKAGVASVMCSYNQVNSSYACGNSKLLNGILKDEMGFQGFVMSDWLAQRSGVASALAGLDMTMPGDGLMWMDGQSLWGSKLTQGVLNGSVPLERINDMATRIVASWYQLGQDDKTKWNNTGPNFSSWTDAAEGVIAPASGSPQEKVVVNQFIDVQGDHGKLARKIAAEGTVLLKNTGILPLKKNGEAADGSIKGKAKSILVGIYGEDAGPGDGPNACPDRSCNQGTLGSGWGSGSVEFPYLVTPAEALNKAFADAEVTETLGNNIKKLKDVEKQDVCIVFASSDAGEGYMAWGDVKGDRNDLNLQKGGDRLISHVADKCGDGKSPVIVVVHAVGPVVVEKWIEHPNIHAVIHANLPGQESGNALADVLLGEVNPSGKLPYTIGKSLSDYGEAGQIMYRPNGLVPQQTFSEGLYIDYRHFDKHSIEPRFSFGYGLSYTGFEYSNLTITGVKAKSEWPAERPKSRVEPPTYDAKIPDKEESFWPAEIRKLDMYVYPYIDKDTDITPGDYPYPEGYSTEEHELSPAGGGEGGNEDLWETYLSVTFTVENIGKYDGQVVPQLYMSYPEDQLKEVDFPVRVLRGFDKILLKKKEKKEVTLNLTRRDLSFWDVEAQNWRMVTGGAYKIVIGESSRDVKLSGKW